MPNFHVVRMNGIIAVPVLDGNGDPVIYPDAVTAQHYAQHYSYNTGVKHQPRPIIEDVDWRKREQNRFDSGHYTHVPWHKEEWVCKNKDCADHFVHVARQNTSNIAFTIDEKKALLDQHTAMRPSKYLTTYYNKILKEDEIRAWVGKFKKEHDKDAVLHLAYTAKDIVRVYRNGPGSCMGGKKRFLSKVHPASCYEGPDLAIAYAQRQGHISARCVVWPAKKLYSRIYGDIHFLQELLHEEGYQEGSMRGARMTKIKDGDRYVCPYIDYEGHVHIGVKWMRIGKGKFHSRYAANQDGFCGRGFNCPLCAANRDADKVVYHAYNGQNACELCINKGIVNGTIGECITLRQYFPVDRLARLYDGRFMYLDYFYNEGFTCRECGKCYPSMRKGYMRNGTAKASKTRNKRGYLTYTATCVHCPIQAEMDLTMPASPS